MLITETIKPIPAFAHLAGRTVTCTPPRALRRRMRSPEQLSISQWAAQYRRVTEIDASPGPWRNELVPHLVKIMDTIGQPFVREVWICAPERSGKTQLLINTCCWAIDQGSSSGNIFWLMPTEADSRKALGERIIPVFRAKDDHGRPGRIAGYLNPAADDTTRGMIRFNHGIRLFPAWANSPASMASYFGRLNIADECDKFPERTSEGSDPITLFRKRARDDRHRSKYLYASTPAGKFIYKGVMNCHQVKSYRLRCPDCGEYVLPTAEHLIIPDHATPDQLERNGCEIACPKCGALWDEDRRRSAYHAGKWVSIKGADDTRPPSVGWHMTAFCLPSIPLGEIAAAWLRAQTGDLSAKIAWANGYLAEDYEQSAATSDAADILALCDDRPRDLVPANTAALLMQVDTQQDGFYYEIRAALWGETTSKQVREGYVLTFADLREVSRMTFKDAAGSEFRVHSAVIDSGGTTKAGAKHSRTSEVYAFCKENPIFRPVKGVDRAQKPWRLTNIENWPGTNKAIKGGLQLYSVNVNYYKDDLAGRLQVAPDDPGAWRLYSGYTVEELQRLANGAQLKNRLEEYASHFCSEYRDETGQWLHDRKKGRNDYFDCGVYYLFHADLLRVAEWQKDTDKRHARRVISKGVQR